MGWVEWAFIGEDRVPHSFHKLVPIKERKAMRPDSLVTG